MAVKFSVKHVLNLFSQIRSLYASVYVEYAAKNPMSVPGEMITSNLFRTKVLESFFSLQIFLTKLPFVLGGRAHQEQQHIQTYSCEE